MEIHLAPETQAQLEHLAVRQGKALPQVVEETFARAWELLQEQDVWLAVRHPEIETQIQAGLDELERGEGIPGDELDNYLTRLESQAE